MAAPPTYQELMDSLQLGRGIAPPTRSVAPVPGATAQPSPFDTSVMPGTAFGAPYPLPGPTDAPPEERVPRTDVAPTGITPTGAPPTTDPATGYTPQPRPELPKTFGRPKNADLFGDYSSVYNAGGPQEEDPLAALFGPRDQASLPGMPGAEQPPSRALQPPWMGGAQTIDQAAGNIGQSAGEKALLRKSPAYGRAIERIRTLERMRGPSGGMAQRGPAGPARPGGGLTQRRL